MKLGRRALSIAHPETMDFYEPQKISRKMVQIDVNEHSHKNSCLYFVNWNSRSPDYTLLMIAV